MATGSHSTANPPPSPFTPARPDSKPIFGNNVQYIFSTPFVPPPSPWSSRMTPAPEAPEVDMRDAADGSPSPAYPRRVQVQADTQKDKAADREREKERGKDKDKENRPLDRQEAADVRPMSNVAVRRVERARRKQTGRDRGADGRSRSTRRARGEELTNSDEDEDADEEDGDDNDNDASPTRSRWGGLVARKTSNHYTLNMNAPGPSVSAKADTPYVLLGCVLLKSVSEVNA